MMREKLVEIKGLKTHFKVGNDWAKAVDGVDFDIYKGETLGIVGESGSGKSVSVLSLIQLIPNPPGEVFEGEIYFKGQKIYDGIDFQKVMQIQEYRYFPSLSEKQRKWSSTAFFFLFAFLLTRLPFAGLLVFLGGIILDSLLVMHFFYNSPRKKALAAFREKMYEKMRSFRGREIAMIFQEPMTSLNPVFSIGMQVVESIRPKSFREYIMDSVINIDHSLRSVTTKSKLIVSGITASLFLFFGELGAAWTFHFSHMLIHIAVGAALPIFAAGVVRLRAKFISPEYISEKEALWKAAVRLLDVVGIPDAEKRMKDYPHQFSGGMRQRVMIAMALAKDPSLLIADEPTTALDVTIQAQILDLMLELKQKNTDAAIVLITHDLAVVAETCERVIVMYGGKIQEIASVEELFDNPAHPYTIGLLNSIPRPDVNEHKERLQAIRGMVPSILNLPEGCRFCTRCDLKIEMCDLIEPPLIDIGNNHWVRCHVVAQKMDDTK